MEFKLKSSFKPVADQQKAINSLVEGNTNGQKYQVLLGVTGSGKTYTIANLIEKLQKPALIISHNKTLAAQLYQEFRDFFPENAVSYFVSYYDYYQPEAYIPSTDTYIEKDADINDLIDKLRLSTTTNLLTRKDVIVIASISCIYNIGSPLEYANFVLELSIDLKIARKMLLEKLIDLQYERADFGFHRGTFRVMGDTIDIYPAYQDEGIRLLLNQDTIKDIKTIDPVSGSVISKVYTNQESVILYPAKHFMTDPDKENAAVSEIKNDLIKRIKYFKKNGKELESYRIKQKVEYDMQMIKEIGYVKGIENYSRYFDGRQPGDIPYSLLEYFRQPFNNEWLTIIDESHITFPQIRGMYNGDLSRKKILVDYGFRLPAAYDNRPLKFEEFMRRIPGFIAASATPSNWEINMANESAFSTYGKKHKNAGIVEQLLRPTGIPDPKVEIRPAKTQVADVINEIKKVSKKHQRTLVTTLTKRTAEDLSQFLIDKGMNVQYLHSDVATLERTDILDDLRRGTYDVLIGVNLLREGLDLPEVALVAILDADKEGFLRSEVSLIQTMGRAARHAEGRVILYADNITNSIKRAMDEVKRRRKFQLLMNKKYSITPKTIEKPIRDKLVTVEEESNIQKLLSKSEKSYNLLPEFDLDSLTPMDKNKLLKKMRREMSLAAQDLNFELAAEIRDKISELAG